MRLSKPRTHSDANYCHHWPPPHSIQNDFDLIIPNNTISRRDNKKGLISLKRCTAYLKVWRKVQTKRRSANWGSRQVMGVNDGVCERESAFSSSKSSLGYFSISTEQKHKKRNQTNSIFWWKRIFLFKKRMYECLWKLTFLTSFFFSKFLIIKSFFQFLFFQFCLNEEKRMCVVSAKWL